MNWRTFGALFRREVRRGRRTMLVLATIAGVLLGSAFFLARDVALAVNVMGALLGVVACFAPLGDLRQDKTLGYLEFDRVLPIAHRAMATARLFGAAVRTSPLVLFALPFIVTLNRGHSIGVMRLVSALAIAVAIWLVLTSIIWALMAVNIRWNLRRLWWLPMTIWLGPQIAVSTLPAPIKTAMRTWIERTGTPVVEFVSTPIGIVTLAVIVVTLPVALFWLAISLFASGLERYTYDASAAIPMSAKPPKRELAAIGRGPAVAVARYCIRLATEQSRRRLILLGVFVVALLFGSHEIKQYARFYVRALAAMIPGGIALQLSVARTRGNLEGIQQLPQSAVAIGTGYLLGIAVLATPGAAVWVLARAVTGEPATASGALSLWAWMVGWSWLASVSVLWLTVRRTLMIASVPLLAAVSWVAYVGPAKMTGAARAAVAAFTGFRASAGVAFPLALAVVMMIGGLPLFARGLTEYEFAGPKRTGRLGRSLRRIFPRGLSRS